MAKTKGTVKKPTAKKSTPVVKKKESTEKPSPVSKGEICGSEKRDTMTTDEVARYAGVTTARISQLKKDGVIIPLPSGSRKEGDFWKPMETFIKLTRHYRELSDSRSSKE